MPLSINPFVPFSEETENDAGKPTSPIVLQTPMESNTITAANIPLLLMTTSLKSLTHIRIPLSFFTHDLYYSRSH